MLPSLRGIWLERLERLHQKLWLRLEMALPSYHP
jgi:hypothetical protein